MNFTKMQGAGNDYIYINCFREKVENPALLSKRLSHRHFGVGADGIVLIKPSKIADCFMDIYNADGSRAEMCGNAVRCVAKFVADNEICKKSVISVETVSGIKRVITESRDGKVVGAKVNMGTPIFSGHLIPTRYGDSIVKNKVVTIDNRNYEITCLSMGNPHSVVFCKDIENLDLYKIGPLFENYEMFPERINTEFAQIISPDKIKARVWERGSGETLACGTGACAICVAAVLNGFSKQNCEIGIHLPGGILTVCWNENNNVYLSGDAVEVFKGNIDI